MLASVCPILEPDPLLVGYGWTRMRAQARVDLSFVPCWQATRFAYETMQNLADGKAVSTRSSGFPPKVCSARFPEASPPSAGAGR
jgi:hypothetical protein